MSENLEFFSRLIRGIAEHFGEKCEVVLHDLKDKPYESTIVAIENGHVTGRRKGDCGTNLGLEVLRGTDKQGDRYNYMTQTKEGRILKSSSIYIRDDSGAAVGSICINFDVTNLIMAERTLAAFTNHSLHSPAKVDQVAEYFTGEVGNLLDQLIQDSIRHVGKPVINMTKEDKKRGIQYLDTRGTFLIKKSADKIAKYYDISKYTLYSYLEETRTA